ncbi:MAG TPA: hypothetical protein VGF45_23535 [Polyangia bacterium]
MSNRASLATLPPDLRRLLRSALGCLLVGVLGCVHHVPTVPMRSELDGISLDLQRLRVGTSKTFTFVSRSTEPLSIERAWLTTATRGPCAGGQDARLITVNGAPGGAIAPGEQQVAFEFAGPRAFDLDVVMDVRLHGGRCVRVPVVSGSLPFDTEARPLFVVSLDLLGVNRGFSDMNAVQGLRAGAGYPVGPFVLSAEAGIGYALCDPAVCGKDDSGQPRSQVTPSYAAQALYAFPSSRESILFDRFFLGLGYRFQPVRLPTPDETRRFTTHLITLAPGMAEVGSKAPPHLLRNNHRSRWFALAIPIGVAIAPSGNTKKVGFVLGLDLRIILPI